MRLASKIFLGFSLVIVVLAAVGVLSLRAVGRLVSLNREVASETLPAFRLTAEVRDAMLALARLEARFTILRDARYAELWRARAANVRADLTRLRALARTEDEARHLAEAAAAFERYHDTVAAEQARLAAAGARAPAVGEPAGRALAERVEVSLEALQSATHARVLRAQAEVARLETRTWTGVVVALAAAVGLALLATAVIALRITRSLRRLSVATSAVAAGAFREPVPTGGRDEVGVLARAFNAMAERLRQLDETKEEFFATLSHELRSPLTSVREAAHLLADEVAGPLTPKQARLVEIVQRSSDRLLRLVNQILDISRLRAGLLPLAHRPVDLERLVSRAAEELRPQAEEARVTLDRERVGERFTVTGDEDRLVQVVVNLLANAIRFTPAGGRVVARVVDAGEECEVQVEDTGLGIPATELPHIFETYRQAHLGKGGTGLGLSIVRGLVQAHGGRVTVESHEGKGSRFSVLLPREAKAA
ncbi:MAG TPA: ATP-binding protein [Candidatus Binatia bacterium]|nr:ATP-binding protein [Candidatus Binatia bacterium]